MNYIEKLLKKRFDNGRSEEGVEADELWAAISPMLPEKPPIQQRKNSRRWLLLLLLLFVLLGVGSYYYFIVSPQSIVANNPIAEQTPADQLPASTIEIPTPTASSQVAIVPPSTENLSQQEAPRTVVQKTRQSQQNQQDLSTPSLTTIVTNNASTNTPQSTNVIPQETNITQQILPPGPTSLTDTETTAALPQTVTLASLDLPFSVQSQQTKAHPKPTIYLDENIGSSAASSKAIQLGIFSGINVWKNQFTSSTAVTNLLTEGNKVSLGQTFAAELQLALGDHLNLVSGLAYQLTEQEFNLVQTWDTVMYRDNVPGSDLINARATRTVKHHNQFNFWSVPVLLSIDKSWNKTTLGVDAGLTLNYRSKQQGKTLNSENEVVYYPTIENANLPHANFFIAYQFRPFVSYALTDKIDIRLRSAVSLQQLGQSDFYGSRQRGLLGGLHLGGFYAL